ncbi:MAG: ATP-binding protein [Agathobacter sp.]|nr:ATP-binding protein [Agathobacter sp.]
MGKFINRTNELNMLKKQYEQTEASFVVIYGRRRIGKSRLIQEFVKDKKCISFLATEENELENRNMFKNKVADVLNNPLLKSANIERWEPIFDIIADACDKEKDRLVIVLDEFQYLGKANSAFPSIMMSIWDEKLKDKNVMLILCGSLINMMSAQVLNYDSPLYGRRTAQKKLQQIPFNHYHEFLPDLSVEEQIQRYALTGGVPKYIELFHDNGDVYEAIRDNILNSSSFLFEEPEFLLRKEVSEVGSYFSILKVIAAGNHKLGNISTVLNIKQSGLSKYLSTLCDLDILERQVPITEENPEKSKKGLYFIKDNFIRFWFKFVFPYRDILESKQDEFVIQKLKQSFIDSHVSYVYEDICREKIWELNGKPMMFNRVGRWWNKDTEIDIVAYDSMGNDILFGECKYSEKPKGIEVLSDLRQKSHEVIWKNDTRKEYFVIFSKSGFTKELENRANESDNIILEQ